LQKAEVGFYYFDDFLELHLAEGKVFPEEFVACEDHFDELLDAGEGVL
jgi:hypothetical protein